MIPERRQTTRIPCCYQVSCQLNGEAFPATVSDMGLGGMRLLLPRRLAAEARLVVEQSDLSERGTVELTVVWTRQLRSGEVETGVAYEGPPERLEQSWIKPALQRLGFEARAERRQHVRVGLSAGGHLEFAGQQVPCTVVDLGLGGALIEGPQPPPSLREGESCQLVVDIPDCSPLAARVVYHQKLENGWRCGLRFEPDRLTRSQARLVEGYLSALG